MKRNFRRILVFWPCLITALTQAIAAPVVENFNSKEIVRHPVILLRGTVEKGAAGLEIRTTRGTEKPVASTGVIHDGKFKALVELTPGENTLELKTNRTKIPARLKITFQPIDNPHYVRLIWLTDKTGDTSYAVPEDDFPQTYQQRLITAALLMQAFTAERMHELGYGRRTFRLESDRTGHPIVHTVKAPESAEHYQNMPDDQQLWRDIGSHLNDKMPDPYAKNMVLMAFTRKDADTGRMLAHTALGGGNLGLFGSASMFSWPESIPAAQATFLDDRKVDPRRVHEDSAGRGLYWAVASTTIGATLHEMGHTFGLPHCEDSRCIMTRGFDRFNRFFTFTDPWPDRDPETFPADQEAWFAPVSASFLRWSPWFQPDLRPSRNGDSRPELEWNADQQKLTASSRSGVRWLGFYQGGDIRGFKEYPGAAQRKISITLEEIVEANGGKTPTRIVAADEKGNVGDLNLNP